MCTLDVRQAALINHIHLRGKAESRLGKFGPAWGDSP